MGQAGKLRLDVWRSERYDLGRVGEKCVNTCESFGKGLQWEGENDDIQNVPRPCHCPRKAGRIYSRNSRQYELEALESESGCQEL